MWATDGMLNKYNCCSVLDGMEKLLVSSDGGHHPFLTEQGESPESTSCTLTVRIPSNSDWARPTRSPCERGVCCAWCLSWNIFFRNWILEDHLEFVKLLEIHFRLRILLSWAIPYAVLLQTTKQLLYRLVTVWSLAVLGRGRCKIQGCPPRGEICFLSDGKADRKTYCPWYNWVVLMLRYTLCQVFVIVR
jgi:hypothetical protein